MEHSNFAIVHLNGQANLNLTPRCYERFSHVVFEPQTTHSGVETGNRAIEHRAILDHCETPIGSTENLILKPVKPISV